MKPIEKLLHIIGSPYLGQTIDKNNYSDKELLEIYDLAFENRVALLYLDLYRRPGWDNNLEEKYQNLKNREKLTIEVIKKLAETLNERYRNDYIIFKSIKPYPATPNDTDVLFLGSKKEYNNAYNYLLHCGYIFHEWAPQQKTLVDPRGKNKIGKGKKGGIYYIDFYEEISTDYYAYLNKNNLKPYIKQTEIDGVNINLLEAEPELAIILFHNVFPERTFQLEHFYLPLFYFKQKDFCIDSFLDFVFKNKLETAIQANLSLISYIHKKYFDIVPDKIEKCIKLLGKNEEEVKNFINSKEEIPYLFSPKTFWKTFFRKSIDRYSFRSLMVQSIKMLNPWFLADVIKSLKNRLSEKGVYHLE